MPSSQRRVAATLIGLCFTLLAGPALGGGGPENVLLVFNSTSADSTEIANFYARLRRVPAINLVGIPWQGSLDEIEVEEFRQKLLTPILATIKRRGLGRQINCIAYSSDFPWRIRLHGDLKDRKPNKSMHPFASLTGATYLYRFVMAKSPTVLGLKTNWYAATPGNLGQCKDIASTPSRAFRALRLWGPDGKVVKQPRASKKPEPDRGQEEPTTEGTGQAEGADGAEEADGAEKPEEANKAEGDKKPTIGINYLMSTMLAVTAEDRGNTVEESKAYLLGAARADAIPPKGAFYFIRSGDPRSRARHDCFEAVIAELRSLGARAEQLNGKGPWNAEDALGVMMGAPSYDLRAANVKMMPGAIGDNLTSYGGIFTPNWYQTPLSEMLRNGAAGASGTVFEPTALQAKFALPTLFLHYRRGCSLAESYYQSLSSPYQLLIVGDPLCQPWAKRPRVTMPGFRPGQKLSEPLTLRPTLTPQKGERVVAWDFFLDGRLATRLPPSRGIKIDPRLLKPGPHELRVIAIGGGPIESQGRWVSNFVVENAAEPVESEPGALPPPAQDPSP